MPFSLFPQRILYIPHVLLSVLILECNFLRGVKKNKMIWLETCLASVTHWYDIEVHSEHRGCWRGLRGWNIIGIVEISLT